MAGCFAISMFTPIRLHGSKDGEGDGLQAAGTINASSLPAAQFADRWDLCSLIKDEDIKEVKII